MPDARKPFADTAPLSFEQLQEVVEGALVSQHDGHDEDAIRAAIHAQRFLDVVSVPQTHDGSMALNRLGMVWFLTGYSRSAATIYHQALAIAETLDATDALNGSLIESVLNNLGQVHARLGEMERARTFLERAASLRGASAPDTVSFAMTLDNLGAVYMGLRDLERAHDAHTRALAILQRERGPFDSDVATTLGNLSALYRARGDLDRAEAYRLRAFDIQARRHGLTNPQTLIQLTGLVALSLEKGDQARTDQLVNHALRIGGMESRPEHRNLAEALQYMARSAAGEARIDLIERLNARAVELLEALDGPSAPETLSAVHALANAQRANHDLDHAERSFQRALRGFEALGDRDTAVAVSIDLAKVYRERGAYDVAEAVLTTAVSQLREGASPNRLELASALGNLAEVYYEWQRHEVADATYAEALDASDESSDDYPWLLHGRAVLNYHLGRYEAARDLYERAHALWVENEGPDHPYVATTSANLALAHWALGDTDGALAAFEEAAERREIEMRRVLAVGSERKRLLFAANATGDLDKAISFALSVGGPRFDIPRSDIPRFAARQTLRHKGLVLDAMAHTFAQVRAAAHTEDHALAERLHAVRTEIAGVVTPSPLAPAAKVDRARLSELREEEERIEASLSYRGALEDPDLAPVTLESIQAAIPTNAALVEIVQFRRFNPLRSGRVDAWSEDRYGALVLRAAGDPHWMDLGATAVIDEKSDQLRRLVRSRASNIAECEGAATELYRILIAPLEDAIADASRLLISPDGRLSMLPFGILRDDAGRPLASRFSLSYLATGREVRHATSAVVPSAGVVVIAAPDYDMDAPVDPRADADHFADRGSFAPLPGAFAEAEELSALLDNVTVLSGASATVDELRALKHPALLHIATHGFFSPIDEAEPTRSVEFLPIGSGMIVTQQTKSAVVNPMFFSGLALSGANRRTPGTSTGIVTAQQLAGLDLRGTQLVVLSACETGLGAVERGLEFTGMRRALSIAGAAAQVTSLWRVGDEATRTLMRHFYDLLAAGAGRAEALSLAQERVASDAGHPEWRHPFYWAAFVLSGAWTPMPGALTRRRGDAMPASDAISDTRTGNTNA